MTTPAVRPYTITLESGSFSTHDQVSILDAALASGVPVPFSCRRGECGSCRAQVLDGEFEPLVAPTERSYVPASDELLMCQCRATSDLALRFPHWQAPDRPPARRDARVVTRRPLTANVTELIVEVQGDEPFDYRPGQHVLLLLEDGRRRPFSIASVPQATGDRCRLQFHIRRMPGGVFTDGVLPALMPGDTLALEGPQGACVWPGELADGIEHLVLLATGTGFAGVFPILMAAIESRRLRSVTLYWGGREPDDCYAAGLLNALQGKDTIFRWQPVVSNSSSRYVQDVAADAGHDWQHSMVYACGNPGMVRAARQRLQQQGLPEQRFQSEAFVPSDDAAPTVASSASPTRLPPKHPWEQVGARFTMEGILQARRRSIAAVHEIAALIRPGMTTAAAIALADQHLRGMGASHNWHPTYIRFGADSQSPAIHPTDRQRVLGEDDIFVVDIGPVWDNYEGDYGDTFATGPSADHARCAEAARLVFQRTRLAWLQGLTGAGLYDAADGYAREYGCTVVREIPGHRVADFPHALYGKHQLAAADFVPSDGIWVLEIQVRDLHLPIGAFYEDVLLREDAVAII
ncbi:MULTISPECIES: NAD(P)H dependent flavin oxidoreductase family protein [unclassified Achromobacter]|uniref:NAD(P)H dependent flavin oxidoreductase family protein n=1 Tax=unclassified Achromobacter TaxID=2626865 RepID=UPI000B517127|nr:MULTISPECIES: NAD(P)H dependent flavin oxidoreductase family protein [unclassified Achromobacter]OWT73697.1 2Fe-2S ferredoxin [Achromobacter sp. HZ34]OWT79387.1 2Fe-2S ferredoxin [Achromobacter sp. HZ28]